MTQGFTNPFGSLAPALTFIGPTLPNPTFVNGFTGNAGTGDIDLYTVPAGRRAFLVSALLYNSTGSNITANSQIKISGTYYRLNSNASVSTVAISNHGSNMYVAEAGEIVSLHTSATGLNVWYRIIEFDNSLTLYSAKLTSLANGDNTVYTVPAAKTAQVLNGTLSQTINGLLAIWNKSGGARTYNAFAVPSGGSSGTTNKFLNGTATTADDVIATPGCPACLSAGDFIVLNTDAATATQFAFVTVYET